MQPFVRFDRVRRSFDGQTDVVRDLSLDVARGEFLIPGPRTIDGVEKLAAWLHPSAAPT